MTSFFHFVNKRAIYRLGIISLAHAPVHVTDFPVVNVHVDELSSARIWQEFCINLNIKLMEMEKTWIANLLATGCKML
jgi:hypothetical protein